MADEPTSILILDDNHKDVAHLETELLTLGYEEDSFIQVSFLKDAIELVYERPFLFAIVDLNLPDANGTEIVQQLVACSPGLPIIVVSSDPSIEDALACGAQEVIVKGEIDQGLSIAIRKALLRKKADLKIRYRATHDPLTGIFNRSHFLETAARALTRNRRYSTGCGVVYIDLDNFKPINDQHGHHAGDKALKTIASRLQQTLRDGDIVARLGGDEFAILVEDVRDQDRLRAVAQRVLRLMGDPLQISPDITVQVSCSMGLAWVTGQQETNAYDLLKSADAAMFTAKNNGGSQFQFADFAGQPSAESDLAVELHGALERNELFLVFQPQIRMEPTELIGLEALLRWNRHPLPRVGPDQFIPMLEQSGQIVEVGAWVLREAVTKMAEWSARVGKASPRIAVNVAPQQLEQEGFTDMVAKLLSDTAFDPTKLELEITETTLMHDTGLIQQALQKLRAMGVRIVLDDFGTGYASLSYLLRHPVDGIKIDRSFITPLEEDNNSRVLVQSVIDLAHRFGVDLVAEGVENHFQEEFLRLAKCDACQGYLFGVPGSLATWDVIMRL